MEYKHLSLDEILAKVDAKYSRKEQNDIAFELVESLMDSTDDLDEDFDAMEEYFEERSSRISLKYLRRIILKYNYN